MMSVETSRTRIEHKQFEREPESPRNDTVTRITEANAIERVENVFELLNKEPGIWAVLKGANPSFIAFRGDPQKPGKLLPSVNEYHREVHDVKNQPYHLTVEYWKPDGYWPGGFSASIYPYNKKNRADFYHSGVNEQAWEVNLVDQKTATQFCKKLLQEKRDVKQMRKAELHSRIADNKAGESSPDDWSVRIFDTAEPGLT